MRRHQALALAAAALGCAVAVPATAQTGPSFSVYPSYAAKFDIGSEKFSLVTSLVVYNISGQPVTDVTFKQTYPDGVTVKETYQREVGSEATGEQSSERKVQGNVFTATTPVFKNRQWVAIFNELQLARRLTEITFPGLELSYTDPQGQHQTATLDSNTYDLFRYSNVVGGLERFLKKYNQITFDFAKATPNRKEWEFAPKAASAAGTFPTGIIGTNDGENQYNGYFRLRTGPPGDNIQLLVIYKGTEKKEKIADKDALMKRLHEYVRWCGEFNIADEGLDVKQQKWQKYDGAWIVNGQWVDTIKNRLGGGPVTARVLFSGREDVEYFVIGLAHGRGTGPEGSAQPAPEKEAALSQEMDHLIETFRSGIVPTTQDRRP